MAERCIESPYLLECFPPDHHHSPIDVGYSAWFPIHNHPRPQQASNSLMPSRNSKKIVKAFPYRWYDPVRSLPLTGWIELLWADCTDIGICIEKGGHFFHRISLKLNIRIGNHYVVGVATIGAPIDRSRISQVGSFLDDLNLFKSRSHRLAGTIGRTVVNETYDDRTLHIGIQNRFDAAFG